MQVVVGKGNVGPFPLEVAAAHLENGDVGALIKVTKWPLIGLSAVALAGVGWMIFSAMAEETRRSNLPRTSLARFAYINAPNRFFKGTCLEDVLMFTVDDQEFSVPLDRVRKIVCSGADGLFYSPKPGYDVELIDDSRYRNACLLHDQLTFGSFAGVQAVRVERGKSIKKPWLSTYGAQLADLESIKNSYKQIVEASKRAIVNELGPEFEKIWNARKNH
jgi:hypothetical protein